jgi:hypothetical protein
MFTMTHVGTKKNMPTSFFFVALLHDVNALPIAVVDGNKQK